MALLASSLPSPPVNAPVPSADDLAQCDDQARRTLRAALDKRRHTRISQRRFRRDSQAFLADLEARLLKLILPS